jgi:ribosomal-protein-alanine N-acetyltransferase
MIKLETEHLILRQWKEEDLITYAKITSSKEVMRYFPKTLTTEQSNTAARKFMKLVEERSWGFLAVEEKSSGKFIGYAGLHAPQSKFPFSPCVEIAWRMADKYWENGYVLEAGEKIIAYAFEIIGLEELVYFSSLQNVKGEKVVKVLGMKKEDKNFNHPFVKVEHKLSEHYLYTIKKQ